MTSSFKARNTSKNISTMCGAMCSALTMMGKIMVVMIMVMIGMNDNLSEDPKDTRTAPSLAESRRVCNSGVDKYF